jgi:hypothetical protein
MWSLCLAEEERRTDHHRAIRNSSFAMQEPADVLDEGAESDNDSTISDSSESSFESYFEEGGSEFKAEKSDCEVQRASSALEPTAGVLTALRTRITLAEQGQKMWKGRRAWDLRKRWKT